MNCPVCARSLEEVHVELPNNPNWDEMRVDVCEGGCGGMWFDRFELEKVDEPDEVAGEVLLETERDRSIEVDHDADRTCPKCGNVVMMDRFFSVNRTVEIDKCGGCAGIWLDAGELEDIRQQFDSEEERQEAFEEHFAREMAPKLEQMESSERDNPILRALRFICPSYYIPGDQTGGAY